MTSYLTTFLCSLKTDLGCLLKLVLIVPFFPVYICSVVFLYLLSLTRRYYTPPQINADSIVLITGCDSGIGRVTACKLIEMGFHVICGVTTEEGGNTLREETSGYRGDLNYFVGDIIKEQSVNEFGGYVESILQQNKRKRIVGLINNAGIVLPGPIELQPINQVQKQLDVNFIGQLRIIQQFLARIRRSKGRIINMGSLYGRFAGNLLGAHNASKCAMEAITDTLRLEMLRFGVSVSLIEPGFVNTPMLESFSGGKQHQVWDSLMDFNKNDYQEEHQKFITLADKLKNFAGDPEHVACHIIHALISPFPKTRYIVGTDANLLCFVSWAYGDRLRDTMVKLFEKFSY
jgi:NAD(P)-dependent dehydrogenase (short-subunit alcohol dehydrogenase family)